MTADPGSMPAARAGDRDFIRAQTTITTPPLVPEIRLHLAAESLPIWQATEIQLAQANVPPPFWAFAWAGGQALARHLLDQRQITATRTVLDLGSGSGLTAIAAGLCGASRIVAADIDSMALLAIEMNADLNGVTVQTTCEDLLSAAPPPFDVVLIGDLFYERQLAERVLAFAQAALASGATVLAGDPKRNYFCPDWFQPVGNYAVPVSRELEDTELKPTGIWQLKP